MVEFLWRLCPSHVASAPWPCDLAHLCKLISQLHLGVACLGLGRELQDLDSGKT